MKSRGMGAILFILVGSAFACDAPGDGGGGEGERLGEAEAEFRDSVGILPFPIKVTAQNQPLLDGAGKVQASWSGSTTDLLAADAWAVCTKGVANYPESSDDYVTYLHNTVKLSANACAVNAGQCAGSTCSLGERWRFIRGKTGCNGFLGSSIAQAPTLPAHGATANDTTYNIASSTSSVALQTAEVELSVAEVNLCVAQKLREDMLTAPTILLSTAEQMEALAHVRERAQIAMLQYAAIGSTLNAGTTTPKYDQDFGAALRAWAPANASRLGAIGADATAAIELHVEATRELGKLMAEQTSTHADAAAGDGWGASSWRARLLHLLYGGDPLGDYGNGRRWLQYKAGAAATAAPSLYDHVLEDNEAPQTQTLLGLARQADALYFAAAPTTYAVDVERSAKRLYLAVEVSLRYAACTHPAAGQPTCEQSTGSFERLPTLDNPTGALVESRHGIKPEHVRSLVRSLAQAMPKVGGGQADLPGAFGFVGSHALLSGAEVAQQLPGETGAWYRLDPKFAVLALGTAERAASFANYQNYFSTVYTAAQESRSRSSLGSTAAGNAAMRSLGAVGALTLARDRLAAAKTVAPAAAAPFFQKATAALPLVGAAVGQRAVKVAPWTVVQQTYPGGVGDYRLNKDWLILRQLMSNDYTGEPLFAVTVVTRQGDAQRTLVTAPARPNEGIAGLDPGFRSPAGADHAAHFGPSSGAKFYQPTTTTDLGVDGLESRVYQVKGEVNGQSMFLTDATAYGPQARFDLVAKQLSMPFEMKPYKVVEWVSTGGTPPTLSDFNRNFRMSETGRYFAPGGWLGAMAARAWSVKTYNWSKADYDGLGLKLDWFPPPIEIAGANDGQSASSFFINQAAGAATNAKAAVGELVDHLFLLQTQAEQLQTARVTARNNEINAWSRLCGALPSPSGCDVSTAELDLVAAGVVPTTDPCEPLAICSQYQELRPLMFPSTLRVLAPVKAYVEAGMLANPAPPAFDMYGDGELKSALLSQWKELRRVRQAVEEFRNLLKASSTELYAAWTKIDAVNDLASLECGKEAFARANVAGFGYQYDDHHPAGCGGDPAEYWCVSNADAISFSPGPFMAQLQACEAASINAAAERLAAMATVRDVQKQILNQSVAASSTSDGVAQTTVDALRLAQDARLAVATAQLEGQRAAAEKVTRFGTYRRFHMEDFNQTESRIANARWLALKARRSVEADFVTDLAKENVGYGPSAPPASWADTVYEPVVDLGTLLSSAGANKFVNYASNLENFRVNYADDKYSMVAAGENLLVELPAPEKRVTVTPPTGLPRDIVSEEVAMWSFFCPNSNTWVMHPGIGGTIGATSALDTLCGGGRPTKARIGFQLDPWGRLDGVQHQAGQTEYRYNMRLAFFAVNLASNADVTECTTTGCTPPKFVNYSLSQFSPGWLSDFGQGLHAYDVPAASTPFSGWAMAKRYNLELLGNDFDTPTGSAFGDLGHPNVRRKELRSRPLGDGYAVVFDVTPQVRLDRITKVQVLFKTDAWVAAGTRVEE